MSSIAIITARGGSKRIPKKNIKEFLGKPILAYSIESAIASGIFDEIMVSTDDDEIKKVALHYGAKVPFMRSKQTSDDYSTTSDVLYEVISEYSKLDLHYDAVCCIYPTAPFITSDRLIEAMDMLKKSGAYSVIPVVEYSYPPQRGFVINNDKLTYRTPEYKDFRSQDLDKIYHDAGQFYCLDANRFMETKMIVTENTIPLILDELEVQDIDNEIDWELAQLKYRVIHEHK
ncbi:MAG: pseudaminic acid cytidylyltransferase [Pseudobutyrivibrio sp.]|nr:pseudaminic acid cytidylyltransferase [Pseudobutyrivibrio sp.]